MVQSASIRNRKHLAPKRIAVRYNQRTASRVEQSGVADWYYIGHYGQIGPLTRETMTDLIETGVIMRETHVWKSGMADWVLAGSVVELSNEFATAPAAMPPPPPGAQVSDPRAAVPPRPANAYGAPQRFDPVYPSNYGHIRSDKSRIVAGLLQLIPGVGGIGRIYLGCTATGVMQLLLSFCGIGYIWSIIDGILILAGNEKFDGYGRQLPD